MESMITISKYHKSALVVFVCCI